MGIRGFRLSRLAQRECTLGRADELFGSRLIDGLKGRGEELELLSGRDATTLEKNDWNSMLDDGVYTTQPGRQLGVDSLLAVAIHSGHCEVAFCVDFKRTTRDHTPTEITAFFVLC